MHGNEQSLFAFTWSALTHSNNSKSEATVPFLFFPSATNSHQATNNSRSITMASKERQAQETRIRTALEINSHGLAILERYLVAEGHVPNTTDEQAARDAVFNLHELFSRTIFPQGSPLSDLFVASREGTNPHRAFEKRESESANYDAVRDLILMLAVRKAQVAKAQNQGAETVVKEEGA